MITPEITEQENVKTTPKLHHASAGYVKREDSRPGTPVSPKARLGRRVLSDKPRSNMALTASQREAARAMFRALEGTGLTPEEVVRRALEGRRAVRRVKIGEAIDLFLQSRMAKRPRTVTWYGSKLGIFAAAFGDRAVDDVGRGEFRRWLGTQPVSESTKMSYTRAAGCLYRWLADQEPPMAGQDVTAGLRVTPPRTAEIAFLPVSEVRMILARIAEHHLPAVVVSLFAGIRPHEVADREKPWLKYQAFNHNDQIVRVPGDVTKTGVPRILEGLPEALWRWLPRGGTNEPIATTLPGEIQEKAAVAAGYGTREKWIRKWPHDAFRHSFATYALALTGDAARVSGWLGHEGKPSVLHRSYAGLTTRAEAERFFGLRPE